MLRAFVLTNREEILARARERFALRGVPLATGEEVTQGLPAFLDQLGEALRKAELREAVDHAEIHDSAGHHGDDLFRQGLSVAQVVNSYGDLCQVITGLAIDRQASITPAEFQTLNICLDDATAGAVTAFSMQRERVISEEGTERLGILAHELRNALSTAMLAFGTIKSGAVAAGGSTSMLVDRSHMRLQSLIDRSLAGVRLEAGMLNVERVFVSEIVDEAEIGGAMVAQAKGLHFEVTTVDRTVIVEADRPVLTAAVANLLQNAFKFTRPGSTVKLRASATTSRVLIEIEDECGGLPSGEAESLLRPFVKKGSDRTGLGLGLSICLKAVKRMSGELHIRDRPGKGCVFAIDLPRQPPAPTSIFAREARGTEGPGVSRGATAASGGSSPRSGRAIRKPNPAS
jgi:signal transduction histidine kinase